MLGDAQIGDFSVQVVRNEPSYVIQPQIEDLFSESRPDDVLLLHFSGHGLKSESGELFFAASNTRPNRLGSTAVAADFVQRCVRDARSRSVVLLLDCCYGGAFAQGVKVRAGGDVNVLDSFPQGKSGGGRGRAVITASNAMEYAFEGDRLADDQHQRPSVFTSALVEGLATGDADQDEDGLVSLNELYDYVFDKVREQNPHQTPSRQFELEGELYLARSRRQRIRPAPIPPDLQAAIADQNMYTRRGAVHELQSRLASEDLPVAVGAYEALAELARTDIQYVADLAAAAMGQAAIRPEETELHFGEQRQGSDLPHRMVRLLGLPIARVCVPHVSDDWIHVTETSGGFDISVDTTGTGTLRGSVDLKGPTGEAVIALDVELLPQMAQTFPTESQGRPVHPGTMAPPVPATRPKGRSAAEGHQQAPQAAEPEPTQQDSQVAATAVQPRAAEPGRAPAPTVDESSAAPQSMTPTARPVARPRIRKGTAYTGTVIALLGGIAGIISQVLLNYPGQSGVNYFFSLAIFPVTIVAAVIALTANIPAGDNRIPPGHVVASSAVSGGQYCAGRAPIRRTRSWSRWRSYLLTGYALGVIAAILLMVAWSPAADRRRAPRIRALPVMLLGAVGLSQIAALIFYVNVGRTFDLPVDSYLAVYFYILGSAGVLVVLAVTWYAMGLRACALGGALFLAGSQSHALTLASSMTLPTPTPSSSGAFSLACCWRRPPASRSSTCTDHRTRRALCFPGAGQNCNVF